MTPVKDTASCLAALYTESFGGKGAGRYRIPAKHVRDLMGQKRVYPDDIHALTRAMFELGYLLIDMDSFYVVLSANSFELSAHQCRSDRQDRSKNQRLRSPKRLAVASHCVRTVLTGLPHWSGGLGLFRQCA